MSAYYNENDPFAAAWLRELIKDNLIAPGEVDERSIADVQPDDLVGYTQCHFFAGIGGWSYALRLAGWGDDRPVWTGSCPCQPFSAAGKGGGATDPRHLWPQWFRLIRECRPHVVFGEQVEAAINHGWLDLVSDDLEREGYAIGAVGLPAASVGAPHIRSRLWFVADASGPLPAGYAREDGGKGNARRVESGNSGENGELADRDPARCGTGRTGEAGDGRDAARVEPSGLRNARQLADAERGAAERYGHDVAGTEGEVEGGAQEREWVRDDTRDGEPTSGLDNTTSARRDATRSGPEGEARNKARLRGPERRCHVSGLGHAKQSGLQGLARHGDRGDQSGRLDPDPTRPAPAAGDSFWSSAVWLSCADGKARPVEPSIFPLASGVPNRVGLLRGAGNAIVPQVAAAFVNAYMESIDD